MAQTIIDLKEFIKQHVDEYQLKDFIFPDVVLTNEQNWENGEAKYSLEFDWAMWGNDTQGGRAYFGFKKDVDLIEKQILNYLSSDECQDSEYYAKWDLPNGFSLILFYLWGYSDEVLSISQDNVLLVSFGASIDDEELFNVLETKLYIHDISLWQLGNDSVIENNPEHLFLIEKMKHAIQCINDKEYYTILKEKAQLEHHVEQVNINQNSVKL